MENFRPTNKEMIALLLHKVDKKRMPGPSPIFDTDVPKIEIYGEKEPRELFPDSEHQENYFFTARKQRRRGQYYRDVGKEFYWYTDYKNIPICDSAKRRMGVLKRYVYASKKDPDSDQNWKWYMKEYTLDEKFNFRVRDECIHYAFCIVKKNPNLIENREETEVESWDVEGFLNMMLEGNSKATSSAGVLENAGAGMG